MVSYYVICQCLSSPKAGMKQPHSDPELLTPLSQRPGGQNIQRLQFALNKEHLDSFLEMNDSSLGHFLVYLPFLNALP